MEVGPRNSDNELIPNSTKKRWWQSISLTIYLSHTLTSWGDRMWGFAVGLYLVILFPESLQNTAIFGFTTCISVIIGAPYIGKWVDKTSRLKAARCALAFQNLSVIFCAILLIIFINSSSSWSGGLDVIFLIFIILFAVIGELSSVASKIALEKDWIVVLADGNEAKLSKMNATMRTIDLTTSILAPAVVAQIIQFGSQTAGAAFIASWNMLSGIVEMYLLHKIYKSIPELSQKILNNGPSDDKSDSQNIPHENTEMCINNNSSGDGSGGQNIPQIFINDCSPTSMEGEKNINFAKSPEQNYMLYANNLQELIPTPTGQTIGLSARDFAEISLRTPNSMYSPGSKLSSPALFKNHGSYHLGLVSSRQHLIPDVTTPTKWHTRITGSLMGWKLYFEHPLRNAGIGLALLCMTVLGFDSITIGYIYSQGVRESIIGILTAVGAVFGILGSVSFPSLRRLFGKCSVGVFGFGFETLCLVFCVVSIFITGSPFIPDFLWQPKPVQFGKGKMQFNSTISDKDISSSSTSDNPVVHHATSCDSVTMFLVGILLSRYGFWIADLSVTQFFQEEVPESQRGILNGVQDTLNQFLGLIKFLLVIVFPTTASFGYLIVLSWIFVFMGWVSFMIFSCSWKKRRNKIECTRLSTTCPTTPQ